MNATTTDWDQILPKKYENEWTSWKQHMQNLESLCIPCQYSSLSFIGSTRREVHLFTDTSEKAIATAEIIKLTDVHGNQ